MSKLTILDFLVVFFSLTLAQYNDEVVKSLFRDDLSFNSDILNPAVQENLGTPYKKYSKMYMPKYAKFKIRRAVRDYSKVLETDYMDYKQNSFITGREIANWKSFTTSPHSTLHDISMGPRISKQKRLDKKKDKNMLPEIRIYGNENAFKSKKKNLNKNRLNPHVHGFPSYKIPNKIPTSFKVDSETNIWPNLEDSRPTKTPTTETSTILPTPPKTYPEEKYSINIPSYKNEIPNFRSNNFSPYKQANDNSIWSITNMDLQKNMVSLAHEFLNIVKYFFSIEPLHNDYSTTTETNLFTTGSPPYGEGNDLPSKSQAKQINYERDFGLPLNKDGENSLRNEQGSFPGRDSTSISLYSDSGITPDLRQSENKGGKHSNNIGFGTFGGGNGLSNYNSNDFGTFGDGKDISSSFESDSGLLKSGSNSNPSLQSKFFKSFDGDSTLSSQFESDSDLIKENGYSNQRTEKKYDDLGVGSTISNRFLSDSGLMKIDANSESNPSKLANFASFGGGNTLSSPFQSDSGLMKIRGYSNPSTQSYLGTFGDGNAKSRFPSGLDTDKNFWPKEFDQLDNQPKTTYSDKEIRYVNKKTTSLDGDIRSKNGMTLLSNTNEDRNLWPIELGGFIQSFNIQKSKLKNKNVENDKDYFENGKEIDLLPCLEGSNCQKGHEPKTFSDENTSPETNGMFEVSPFEVFTPPPIKCKAILKENCRTTCIEVTVSFCCCPIDQIMYSI